MCVVRVCCAGVCGETANTVVGGGASKATEPKCNQAEVKGGDRTTLWQGVRRSTVKVRTGKATAGHSEEWL